MRNKLKIVFMGTPDFAVASLKKIMESEYEVVGVVTAPDKPAGRGRKIQQSAVKQYALQYNIPILQPTNLKDPYFLEALASLQADVFVVVAFRMLPKEVWQMPKYGTFNLHASLLPDYRGAAPINWAIINGETKTGVTTFFIDEKIDTGAIILQQEVAITPTDNAGSLHDKLMNIGALLVLKTLDLIAVNKANPVPQPKDGKVKLAPKIHKETAKINWSEPLNYIHNFIRGLSPYPGAWCEINTGEETLTVKIYETEIVRKTPTENPLSLIIENKQIKIVHPEGYLIVKQLQLPGKRKMSAKELLNGFSFPEVTTVC